MFGVDDADAIALHALAVCGTDASESIARTIESLVKLGRKALEHPGPDDAVSELLRPRHPDGQGAPGEPPGRSRQRLGRASHRGLRHACRVRALIEDDDERRLAASQKRKARSK